jgi:hypothetical protein
MSGESGQSEPSQLRVFRTDFRSNPGLCRWDLAVLGEPAPEPERGLVRTGRARTGLAPTRFLALAVSGVVCETELTRDGQ